MKITTYEELDQRVAEFIQTNVWFLNDKDRKSLKEFLCGITGINPPTKGELIADKLCVCGGECGMNYAICGVSFLASADRVAEIRKGIAAIIDQEIK